MESTADPLIMIIAANPSSDTGISDVGLRR